MLVGRVPAERSEAQSAVYQLGKVHIDGTEPRLLILPLRNGSDPECAAAWSSSLYMCAVLAISRRTDTARGSEVVTTQTFHHPTLQA